MRSNRASFAAACVALLLLATNAPAAPDGVRFAGVPIEGKTVAFVCDGSRWMRNKADELVEELTAAIETAPADRQIAVIFFADGKAFGPNDGKPLPATDANKVKLTDWLDDHKFAGEPTPIPGLSRAFEAKPDAVVFVTDGVFENYRDVEKHVEAQNPNAAARVYTFGFFRDAKEDDSRQFVGFMRQLAERNRGTFKAVYADELRGRKR